MLDDISNKYTKKDSNWFCNSCNFEIYSGKNYKKIFCSCLSKKIQGEIYNNYLSQYYNIVDSKYICKKCSIPIGTNREQHALRCFGLGTKNNPTNLDNFKNFSSNCDMGCGNESKFFYKSGKAYCTKFASKCPIKVETDRQKKLGVNPFAKVPHHRAMLGRPSPLKGLTKETSELVAKTGLAIKARMAIIGSPMKGKNHSQETRDKISKIAKENNYGGYKKGSGRGKQGWYKGFHCDSSWELAYVIYCLEHNISIRRNTERRTYFFNGKTRGYYPDFIVNSDLVEIKGYNSDEWEAKHAANPDVKTLYKEEMKPIIKYAVDKYGKDYIRLYEDKNNQN